MIRNNGSATSIVCYSNSILKKNIIMIQLTKPLKYNLVHKRSMYGQRFMFNSIYKNRAKLVTGMIMVGTAGTSSILGDIITTEVP